MTLKTSMELAGRNLLNCLCPDRRNLPYFHIRCDEQFRVSRDFYSANHNLGRWWDALLRLEHATGFVIPADREAAMLDSVHRFFDNPYHMCMGSVDEKHPFELHSFRENVLALDALARYRHSSWAVEKGGRLIESIMGYITAEGTWDLDKLRHGPFSIYDPPEKDPNDDLTSTTGRLIDGLIPFFETTGDQLALELACRLSEHHFQHSTRPDGQPPDPPPVHTHSYFGTLRGLLLFGELTNQHEYIERVAATYGTTVRSAVKESGFISHDWGTDRRGETTSPGDAAQLALWLGVRHGYTAWMDDVERIVRARELPSQITEDPGFRFPEDPEEPNAPTTAECLIGAYGGMLGLPHAGKIATTDITAAVLHTLTDVYEHIVTEDAAGLRVNLHFDYEDSRAKVTSRRDDSAVLTVEPKQRKNVLIRVPCWAPRESVAVTVNSRPAAPLWVGDYICAAAQDGEAPGEPSRIEVSYPLPCRTVVEPTDGVEYELTWRGDEVVAITPNPGQLPFYPTAGNVG